MSRKKINHVSQIGINLEFLLSFCQIHIIASGNAAIFVSRTETVEDNLLIEISGH